MEIKKFWLKQSIIFIIFTYLISGIGYYLWLPFGLSIPVAGFVSILGPSIASILIFFTSEKKQKVNFKIGSLKDILLSCLIPIIYFGISTFVFCFISKTTFKINTSIEEIIKLTILWIFSGICEEIGWRGTLLPMLNKIMNWKTSSVVCGIIWSLWHIPLILSGTMITSHTPLIAMTLFTLEVVFLTFIMGIMMKFRANISIWPFVLLHAIHNILVNVLVTLPNSALFIDDGGYILVPTIAILSIILFFIYTSLTSKGAYHNHIKCKK